MIRRWLIDIIKSALMQDLAELETRVDFVRVEAIAAREFASRCEERLAHLQDLVSDILQERANPMRETEAQPLAASRASWPRMKKMFEERDVRAGLAARKIADAEMTAGRHPENLADQAAMNRTFNNQADIVAEYWQRKQKGL